MKSIVFSIAAIALLTSAYYQNGLSAPGGSWTFRSKLYSANKVFRHYETTTLSDTTQTPHPKFIIDFSDKVPAASGKFKVISGKPIAAGEIGIGIGIITGGGVTFFSGNGGNGKESVDVIVSDGKIKISGSGIELANQKDPTDTAALSFDITFVP